VRKIIEIIPDKELMKEVKDKVEDCILTMVSKGFFVPYPTIDYSLTGKCAGQAITSYLEPHWIIRINVDILRANRETYLKETIPHEMAHLSVVYDHGKVRRSHGEEWRTVMYMLGFSNPQRCHRYDTSSVKVSLTTRKFKYDCGCRIHRVGLIRHKRINRGGTYYCVKCNGLLDEEAFIGEVEYE
jgi:SprT protein